MALLNGLAPGIYWRSNTGNSLPTEADNWEALTLEGIAAENSTVLSAKYIAIVTGENDEKRKSFCVEIPEHEIDSEGNVNRELLAYNNEDESEYGSVYQWHFFLAYKDVINALTNKLTEKSKQDKENGTSDEQFDYNFQGIAWTNTWYNKEIIIDEEEGAEEAEEGRVLLQWAVDLSYETAVKQFISTGKCSCYHFIPFETAVSTDASSYNNALTMPCGVYYGGNLAIANNKISPTNEFIPLSENSAYSTPPGWVVIKTGGLSTSNKASFGVHIQYSSGVTCNSYNTNGLKLSKYQWEFYFAYKDLIDELYEMKNRSEVMPGRASIYSIPGSVWTSTNYGAKPNSLGAAEIDSEGEYQNPQGLKWIVCPAFSSSQFMLVKDMKYSIPRALDLVTS